ncbi:DMT family transporter [Rhizobium bangladeshense]|uniref:DMT family transporter n=1 Tax=Rhizobium bangladeshense TaxID=1138189 RepID=UPI001A984451|nr:DMT family transporter [Rhizobium bangladeshense]MBX4934966.1 EamA-like transporter family protein [Rhizobium bangladeshense]QSY91475.1 DMT family transporter [Rhizobium bangladeshense]
MTVFVFLASLGGVLVGLSRQLNGRLSISTTPLIASFWNHAVGFAVLTCLGLFIGGLFPQRAAEAPWYAYLGGPIGVIFVAVGSWAIARIGAVNSALLINGGQMVTGVAFAYIRAVPASFWANASGIVLIVGGMMVSRGRRKVDRSQ